METLSFSNAHSDTHTRRKLSDLSLAVAKCKRIVVVTGAGISCSSGIPDFRSSDGLYNLVKERYPHAVLKGRDLFCSSLFRDATSTSVFYTFIAQLKCSIDAAEPGPTHRFLHTLDQKGRLLRSYTQNIDGFEERLGIAGSSRGVAGATVKGKAKLKAKDVRNVQLHGDIHRVRCTLCAADMPCTPEHLDTFDLGVAPDCPECTQRSNARVERSARALKIGRLRPAIVLYDEPHPLGEDIGTLAAGDCGRKPGMLVVMGTSLKVHGLKALVRDFAKAVRAATPAAAKAKPAPRVVFVNRTPPPAEWAGVFDCWVQGETDAWCEQVEADWRRLRPQDWEIQQTLDGPGPSVGLKAQKSTTIPLPKKQEAPTFRTAPREPMTVDNDASDVENDPPTRHQFVTLPASQESLATALPSSPTPGPSQPSTLAPVTPPCSPSKRRRPVMFDASPAAGGSSPPPASSPLSSPARSLHTGRDVSDGEWTDTECSPSKRHKARPARPSSSATGARSLLFADVTNSPVGVPVAALRAADIFGTPLKAPVLPKGRKRDARAAVGSPIAGHARAQPRRLLAASTRTAQTARTRAAVAKRAAEAESAAVDAQAVPSSKPSSSRSGITGPKVPPARVLERGQVRMKAFVELPPPSLRRRAAA